MSKAIEHKVEKFIRKYNLIQSGDNLVVGVSGGADSMMLLHFLYTHQEYYGIKLKAAHVHHGMREEAEQDALFVKDTCDAWHIPYFRHDCNVKELAKQNSVSEEEAGRTERYNFFIFLSNGSGKIVTAHTMSDQAETLVMRFFRGTDVNGLGGIPPKRGNIIRPILCLKRAEVEAYCSYNKISYRDDHTNFMPIYTRNKIRLECIPYIEQNINPNIVSLLGEHSHLYRESEDFLKMHTQEIFQKCAAVSGRVIKFDIAAFESYHKYIQKRLILLGIEVLNGTVKDITLIHLENAAALSGFQSGKRICLPYNIIAHRQYDQLILSCEEQKFVKYEYPIKIGKTNVQECKFMIKLTCVEKETIEQKNEKMYTKYIDYGKIKGELQIRTRLPHDYIMTKEGTKKLKKLFIDDKVPKTLRETMPLVADGDEVVWIVGGRLNTNYYITETTKEVLEIQIIFE
jgi:tRNA(Ile)-lysidine synthase